MIDRSCSLEYRTFQRCSLVGEGESSNQLSLAFCVGGATPTPTSRDVTNQAGYVAEKRCHDDDC
ncbi:hypothetical protein ALC62_12079 [Cyphomyrmex costatus]|uniref:Uncharacterized protein n=1 Tax=Cyphomyrmex costatus TaxID=456900 RepID=A0A151IBU3_9HYME|nr:hypothetical protein ALC62_12079 [Cyphomyrmex costatus]